MAVAATLLGDPGRMPFVGHFRVGIQADSASLAVAGRVGAEAGLGPGFRAAREIEGALMGMRTVAVRDRNDLLRRAWTALWDMAACDFGPQAGADLTIVLAARDTEGMGIAGVGLSGVWGWTGSSADPTEPLVTGRHPLLCGPGLPDDVPGVLTLDAPVDQVVAVPAHLQPVLPGSESLARRCGVHP
jgi:hypothetical protein